MKFSLNNKSLTLGTLVDDYGDVSLYFEEIQGREKVFTCHKANKIILALHSPYFHKLFQSNKSASVFHICFIGVSAPAITSAIKLIYGQSIDVKDNNVNRFESFLKILDIDYTKQNDSDNSSEVSKVKKFKLSEPLLNVHEGEKDLTHIAMNPPSEQESSVQGKKVVTESHSQVKAHQSIPSRVRLREETPSLPPQKGDEEEAGNFLETCTVTSQTGLGEELEKVDFKLLPSASKNKHDEYVCCHCNFKVKALNLAKSHYISHHQRTEEEVKILKESIEHNAKVGGDIKYYEESLQKDFNKIMVICQLETMTTDLERRINILTKMKEKNLAPHHMRKRDTLIDAFTKKIGKVKHLIEIVDK